MKFFQSSSSSQTQLSFKSAGNCLPGVLCRLPCFHGHTTTHRHINELTQPLYAKTNPGIVAKLMGLDSIPQRIPLVQHQEHHGNHRSKTPMVLEIKKGKFFVLGFEPGCKGKGESSSDSKRKLAEDDEAKEMKKKKVVREKTEVLNESEDGDFEMGFLDQLVLELVYVF